MTFPRLWAVLAVLLPIVGTLIANMSSVDLAYHLRAGDEILGGAHPADRHVDLHGGGPPWLDQQWGAQAILAAVYRVAGWTGLVVLRAALVGTLVRAAVPRLPHPRSRPPPRRMAHAGGVLRVGGRPRPSAAALRDGPARGDAGAHRRPPSLAAASLARARHRRGLGQPPRQLLPRAGRRRASLARGPSRPAAGRVADARRCRRRGAGGVRQPVRRRGLELRGRAVDEQRGDGPDHRVAADVAPDRSGHGLLRLGARGRDDPGATTRPS